MSNTTELFASAPLGPLTLPNRLVMAPLTRNRAEADGTPTPLMATYYAQRASAGLIISEAATPNAVGQTYPNITAVHSARHVAGWRQVTDAVREAGGRMFLQLQHGALAPIRAQPPGKPARPHGTLLQRRPVQRRPAAPAGGDDPA